MNAFEIEITIQSKSGASSWPVIVRCKQPDGLSLHSKENVKLTQDDFNNLIAQKENEKEYGILLGKALFQGSVRETFIRAISKTSEDCRLRILLSIEAGDNDPIKTLHWERLCAPIDADGSWRILARDQRVPFSIYIPTIIDRYFPPIGRRDLRALVLIASPTNLGKYQLAPFDVQAVLSGVKESLGDIPFDVLTNNVEGALGPPTLQELSKQLTQAKKPYTILHFVCHGKLLDSGETVLYWATADNQVLPVPGEDLLGELKNVGNNQRGLPQFTFLCSCETADPRAEGALGGLAQRLVRNLGMPAVVAMTRKVSVETALALARSFYKRLRQSGEVDVALQEATAGVGKRHDITVPALFSRLGGRPLFSECLEDRQLTDEEIEYGIDKLGKFLQQRAPYASVLKQRFQTQVNKLKNTQQAESRLAQSDRIQALVELNNISDQLLDLSFDALAALGKEPAPYNAECPFPGLSSFGDKKYHKFFFGREDLVKELEQELLKDNFLAVIGTSGSGKSSVVLAGLIPKLQEKEPYLQSAYMTPGKEPLKQLETRIEELSQVSEQHSVLVVDQFEELFTLCEEKTHRQEFIKKLFHLAEERKVVITMRADFLGECTVYPELRKHIETRQKLVGPMEPAELVIAMKMQADSAGLRFEAGLSHAILNDVQGEPGAMPLLQYALQELWKRRRGRWLCGEEYQAIGGVNQAIAKTANDFYDSLPEFEQQQVQNIFLRLTRLDETVLQAEKRRDTRCRVELEDLVSTGGDLDQTKKLVQQLAGEGVRLVVTSRNESTGKEEVEVAHEALIRHWPMLQLWLNENRSDLQLRQSINQAALEWRNHINESDKDSYLIHQGGRLEDAEKLLIQPKFVRLNQEEAEYVRACVQLRYRLRKQEERSKKQQLVAAASTAVVCAAFAIFAAFEWRKAEIQQIHAFLESSQTGLVSNQPLYARMGSLRAAKELKRSFWQALWPDPDLRNKVLGKLSSTIYAAQEINHLEMDQNILEDGVSSIAFTPAGWLAIVDGKGTVRLWEMNSGNPKELLKDTSRKNTDDPTDDPTMAQLSPDGQFLIVSESDGSLYLWDTKTKKPNKLEKKDSEELERAAFSADSKLLSGRSAKYAYLWDTKTKQLKQSWLVQQRENYVEFSPNGQFLVSIQDNNTVDLENIKTKQRYTLQNKAVSKVKIKAASVKFSPDSQLLAVIPENRNTFYLWNTKTNKWIEAFNKSYYQDGSQYVDINSVEFSPDSQILMIRAVNGIIWLRDIKGRWLAKLQGQQTFSLGAFRPTDQLFVTTDDSAVRLWDISDRRLKVMQAQYSINEIALSPDAQRIATLSKDKNTAYLWDTQSKKNWRLLPRRQGKVKAVAFSPDGKLLMAANTDDGILWLWEYQDKKQSLKLPEYQGKPQDVLFSPDGQHLAVRSIDAKGRTLGVWLGKTKAQELVKLQGDEEAISAIKGIEAISPDGQLLAVRSTKDKGRSVWLADSKGRQLVKLNADLVSKIAFSPDSQSLVTVGKDGSINLWDIQGEQKPIDKTAKHKGGVKVVAFSPDGQLLVTGGIDGIIRLWNIKGEKLAKLQGHQGFINSAVFSANGKLLATSGQDRTLRLWQIGGMDELVAMNCDWLRDYLKNPNPDISESDRHLCDGISTYDNPNQAK